MNFNETKFLVIGLGKTGIATSRFLFEKNANFIAVDSQPIEKLNPEVKELLKKGVNIETGSQRQELFEWADTIVLSPGVSFNNPQIKKAIDNGKKVISEIELAYNFIKKPIIGITGTNGKTTTTTLISEILKNSGKKVFTGGNIGTPLISIAEKDEEFDLVLLELSSFQLQGIIDFKPYIGLILNISDNHLDHHKDFEEYLESKLRLFKNQKPSDFAVLNMDDDTINENLPKIKAKKITFGSKINKADIFYDSKNIVCGDFSFKLENIKLIGSHNIENISAAIAVSNLLGVESEVIQKTIDKFTPLPHRIEYVLTLFGVKVYNDSKSTSPDATLRAIESLSAPIILIAGGKDKGTNYENLIEILKSKVKHLILIGEAKTRMKKQLQNSTSICTAETLDEAVKKALSCSKPNDTLLFSPACSSFDMFRSYEERGEEFKKVVANI